ncbi:hypothetical protein JHK85_007211 [Glycine max]|uniref:Uncharacterized protein n=1 Tax=Glycine max TaxID=3847 RepID=A0A0R0EEV4_SOYBN|nr:hypothetical protein JHK85_007211 [Glycine max]
MKAWWFILLHPIDIQAFICISCHHWTDKHLADLTVPPKHMSLPSILPIVSSLLLHLWCCHLMLWISLAADLNILLLNHPVVVRFGGCLSKMGCKLSLHLGTNERQQLDGSR